MNKKLKIKVDTTRGGYTLDIGDKGYLYFNVRELLTGILVHLGLEEKDPMTDEEMLVMMFEAMLGAEHVKKLKTMRGDIIKLEAEYRDKLDLIRKTTDRIKDYENMADALMDKLTKVRHEIKYTERDYKKSKPLADELMKGVSSLQSTANKLKEEMRETRALIRELEALQKQSTKKMKK